jgi:hypothetical protein
MFAPVLLVLDICGNEPDRCTVALSRFSPDRWFRSLASLRSLQPTVVLLSRRIGGCAPQQEAIGLEITRS